MMRGSSIASPAPRVILKFTSVLFVIATAVLAPVTRAQTWAWDDGTVPYVQTPMEIVERMLRMAEVHTGDYVIDLGSGDGRIVIEAAKRGARGLGVDLDPNLVKLATRNAERSHVEGQTRFEVRDIFDTDLSRASVVTMYLLPDFNAKLLPRLLALKPGTRIVSHDGGIGDWPADETLEMRTPEKPVGVGGNSKVELWIVPADVHGDWVAEVPGHGGTWRFHIDQRYQMLEVTARAAGRELLVRNTRLRGEEVKLVVTGLIGSRPWHHYFVGQAHGDAIDGELTVSTGREQSVYLWHAKRAR
jgi:SAM-dependent methyltransferase